MDCSRITYGVAEGESLNIHYLIVELRNELTNLDHAIRALEKIAASDQSGGRPAQGKYRARRSAAMPSETSKAISAGTGSVSSAATAGGARPISPTSPDFTAQRMSPASVCSPSLFMMRPR